MIDRARRRPLSDQQRREQGRAPDGLERFQNYIGGQVRRRGRRAHVRLARPVRGRAVGGDPRGHVPRTSTTPSPPPAAALRRRVGHDDRLPARRADAQARRPDHRERRAARPGRGARQRQALPRDDRPAAGAGRLVPATSPGTPTRSRAGSSRPTSPTTSVFTRREPVGVVGAITPWNSPLLLMTFKLAPGLAAGCTFVVKPSEHSPASTLAFAQVLHEAGFPRRRVQRRGGLQPRARRRAGRRTRASTRSRSPARPRPAARWRTPPRTTSTGSPWSWAASPRRSSSRTPTCPPRPTGSSPGVFAATGQTCMAGSRVIVHESVHDELVRLVAERANAIKLGDPNDPETEMGPIANQPQYEKVLGYLDKAQKPRARRRRAVARRRASSAGSSSSRRCSPGRAPTTPWCARRSSAR